MESEVLIDVYEHSDESVLYTPVNIPGAGADVSLFDEQFEGCACSLPCSLDCSCVRGVSYYTTDGVLSLCDLPLLIYECHEHCGCNKECPNRLVQKGPHSGLTIMTTDSKGRGLICDVDLKPGTFICEYAGEVISPQEARQRFIQRKSSSNYIFCLREHFGSKCVQTYIDPTSIGNIGRYINHSCDPNLFIVPVRVDTAVPKLCLFACRPIAAGTELTFDYGGGCETKDPEEHSIEKSICYCGSTFCRGFLPFDNSLC